MVENADELKDHIAHLSEKQIAFKIAHDPRVTECRPVAAQIFDR